MAQYQVFISHKDEDRATAIAVRDALGAFSGDLEFFISGQNIPEGEDWRSVLRQQLADSDMLLLLFTEPTREWDWCLYEAGLFTKLDGEENQPVVCIYNPDGQPPSPLVTTQGVPATTADVSRFIGRLVRTTEITGGDRPLNENVTDEQIARAAEGICDHFAGNVQPYYACYRVHLELPVNRGGGDVIPPDSRITGTEGTMRIFGRVPGTSTWGDLAASHIEEEAPWLGEINRVFQDACEGRLSTPTTHTFRAVDGARIFRPELYRLDTKGNTPVAAVIIFTEEVAPAKVGGPVFNRLRIAERYRAEVFDRAKAAPDPLREEDVAELIESFNLIHREARTHKVFDDETLRTSFPAPGVQDELRTIGAGWDDGTDELFAAFEAGNNERVSASLLNLDVLNDQYRAVVARRYSELLSAGA